MSLLIGGGIGISAAAAAIILFLMIGVLIGLPLAIWTVVGIINMIRNSRGLDPIDDRRTLPQLLQEAEL